MFDFDELHSRLLDLTGKNLPLTDRTLQSMFLKIRRLWEEEDCALLHLKNMTGIDPLTHRKNITRIFTLWYNGIKPVTGMVPRFKEEEHRHLFLTHGTLFPYSTHKKSFFIPFLNTGSENAALELGSFLGCAEQYFCTWSGKSLHHSRMIGAESILSAVMGKLLDYAGVHRLQPTTIPVTLAGHGQGGNVMILVANKLLFLGYRVNLVLTINTPVRGEYVLSPQTNRIHLFSFMDWVQSLEGWDFYFTEEVKPENLNNQIDRKGPAGRMVKSAMNICIDSRITDTDRELYLKYRPDLHYSPCPEHQLTRIIPFVIKCLSF